jgi:hypothetical protein
MRDRCFMWIAWRLPRRLVYWCVVRVATHEPTNMTLEEFAAWEQVPARSIMDALQLWSKP